VLLYRRAGRVTAKNGGFRPGQFWGFLVAKLAAGPEEPQRPQRFRAEAASAMTRSKSDDTLGHPEVDGFTGVAQTASNQDFHSQFWASSRIPSRPGEFQVPPLKSTAGPAPCVVSADLGLPGRAARVSGRVSGILSGVNNTQPGAALVAPLGLTMWRGPQAS
jgi:hypothetical protein